MTPKRCRLNSVFLGACQSAESISRNAQGFLGTRERSPVPGVPSTFVWELDCVGQAHGRESSWRWSSREAAFGQKPRALLGYEGVEPDSFGMGEGLQYRPTSSGPGLSRAEGVSGILSKESKKGGDMSLIY